MNLQASPQFKVKSKEDNIIHLYSDGGCRSTAKKGEKIDDTMKSAYAFFLKQGGHEKLDGEASYGKTNNNQEIMGLLMGLKAIKKTHFPVIAYLDSAYVVNCLQAGWWRKWEANGWTKKGGLANAEEWKMLIEEIRRFPFFSVQKVKGHSGNEYNEVVDKYLNKLMDELPNREKGNVL